MLLYLIFGPLLLFIMFSRINGARKLTLTFLLFIGGYGYIMLREATKYHGERKRKREFLERVAPRDGQSNGGGNRRQSSGSNGHGGGGGGKHASYTPSPSPQSRGNSSQKAY